MVRDSSTHHEKYIEILENLEAKLKEYNLTNKTSLFHLAEATN